MTIFFVIASKSLDLRGNLATPSLLRRFALIAEAIHKKDIDCYTFDKSNSRNDKKAIDCHARLRSLAMTKMLMDCFGLKPSQC